MTLSSNLLCSYSHNPYQSNSPQKTAFRLKQLLEETQTLEQSIDKIQTCIQQFELSIPEEKTSSNPIATQTLLEQVEKHLTIERDHNPDLNQLEKKAIFLEKKLKTEKEKSHTEAMKILKSFKQRFSDNENSIKAKFTEFHNAITQHQQLLEQKKLHSKVSLLEKQIPLNFLKIKELEEKKKQAFDLFNDEIVVIQRSLDLLSIIITKKPQNQEPQATDCIPPLQDSPSENPPPPPAKPTATPPQGKPTPTATKAKACVQAKTTSGKKTKESDEEILAQYALKVQKLETPVKKEKKAETAPVEFTFHKNEFQKMLTMNLKDCLSNPFSIFSLKEKVSTSEEFSPKTNKELILEIKKNIQTARQCYQFLKALKGEGREIYLFNNATKMQISIDQILAIEAII